MKFLIPIVTVLIAVSTPAVGSNETSAAPDPMLRQILISGTLPEDGQIYATCYDEKGYRETVVFGSGAAIWNVGSYYRLNEQERGQLIAMLREADFLNMQAQYGGKKEPTGENNGIRVLCRVGLTKGEVSFFSTQLEKGDQSPELRALSARLLDFCQTRQKETGKSVRSLSEGLRGVAEGTLPPEVLSIQLLTKSEFKPGAQIEGWVVRIKRGQASVEQLPAGKPPTRIDSDLASLKELALALAALHPEGWPQNLYSQQYNDLRIEVLGHKLGVQARRFVGMSPLTHATAQKQFDEAIQLLTRFAGR